VIEVIIPGWGGGPPRTRRARARAVIGRRCPPGFAPLGSRQRSPANGDSGPVSRERSARARRGPTERSRGGVRQARVLFAGCRAKLRDVVPVSWTATLASPPRARLATYVPIRSHSASSICAWRQGSRSPGACRRQASFFSWSENGWLAVELRRSWAASHAHSEPPARLRAARRGRRCWEWGIGRTAGFGWARGWRWCSKAAAGELGLGEG